MNRPSPRASLRKAFGGEATLPALLLSGLIFVEQLDGAAFATVIPDIRDHFGVSLSRVLLLGGLSGLLAVACSHFDGGVSAAISIDRLAARAAGSSGSKVETTDVASEFAPRSRDHCRCAQAGGLRVRQHR